MIIISRKTIFNPGSHGFYRFFSWECIIWLLASNYSYWFVNPFSINQLIAWGLLVISIYMVLAGVIMLKKGRKRDNNRSDTALYEFEKTSELIETGIYKYIRHPMYSSLLFLTWGIFFKHPDIELLIISVLSSLFLLQTANMDEKECLTYFGDKYSAYMKRTKHFIPFIF